MTGLIEPLSEALCDQRSADTLVSASKQNIPFTSPLDFISTTGFCAQTILDELTYNTETKVDVIRICEGSACKYAASLRTASHFVPVQLLDH